MQKTMLLDRSEWDLVLDINGNWAAAINPYSMAQDVASAVKTFSGECWYDSSLGIPYWQQILGYLPPLSLVREKLSNEALKVPHVVSARTVITDFSNRILTAQIQITDDFGGESVVNL